MLVDETVSSQMFSAIAVSGVDDVRPVLEHYNSYDNPLEAFKEKQKIIMVGNDLHFQVESDQYPCNICLLCLT